MDKFNNDLSVPQAANLCGVNRNTIGTWIRSGKLRANRIGKNYSISPEELLFFLKTNGQRIPDELRKQQTNQLYFRSIQNCWQYYSADAELRGCRNCTVFTNDLDICFIGKECSKFKCEKSCLTCDYYQEVYYPRIKFIHQINRPAAIYKDLYLWAGNIKWAELSGIKEEDLIGTGIENVFVPNSLAPAISNFKKRELKDPMAPKNDYVFFKHPSKHHIKTEISVYSLNEPTDAWLLIAEITC